MKKFSPYAFLSLLYGALVIWVVPKGCVFGSQTDWLSQHVALQKRFVQRACRSIRCYRTGSAWEVAQMGFSLLIMVFCDRMCWWGVSCRRSQ